MTERELRFWAAYRARKMLPSRRTEIYLAQVALMVARMNGSATQTIDDFLIREAVKAPEMTAEQGAYALSALADGPGVHVLGRKRKRG